MVTQPVTLSGSVDTVRFGGLAVYQDHDQIRLDVGELEIRLTQGQAADLVLALETAHTDALLYEYRVYHEEVRADMLARRGLKDGGNDELD